MAQYNHMYAIAFSLENSSPDGNRTTPYEIRQAILRRLASLTDDELMEAVGFPEDTYEVDAENGT